MPFLSGESHPGRSFRSMKEMEKELDFTFIEAEDPEQCVRAIKYLAKEFIPKNYGLKPISDLQILSPMHRGTGEFRAEY